MKISISNYDNNERKQEKQAEKTWADTIKTRDNWRCVICGMGFSPNAHHIIPREHKQFKFELDNGITLCRSHHKLSRIISAHNNPIAFLMWLEKYKFHLWSVARFRTNDLLFQEGIIV